mmetsp:Transcript_5277/g.19322  ORF Transcript_5277/g.19322 Transcript_5277/m.19322 type:complete len:1005 (+) Transcript_5277:215-3229(+)
MKALLSAGRCACTALGTLVTRSGLANQRQKMLILERSITRQRHFRSGSSYTRSTYAAAAAVGLVAVGVGGAMTTNVSDLGAQSWNDSRREVSETVDGVRAAAVLLRALGALLEPQYAAGRIEEAAIKTLADLAADPDKKRALGHTGDGLVIKWLLSIILSPRSNDKVRQQYRSRTKIQAFRVLNELLSEQSNVQLWLRRTGGITDLLALAELCPIDSDLKSAGTLHGRFSRQIDSWDFELEEQLGIMDMKAALQTMTREVNNAAVQGATCVSLAGKLACWVLRKWLEFGRDHALLSSQVVPVAVEMIGLPMTHKSIVQCGTVAINALASSSAMRRQSLVDIERKLLGTAAIAADTDANLALDALRALFTVYDAATADMPEHARSEAMALLDRMKAGQTTNHGMQARIAELAGMYVSCLGPKRSDASEASISSWAPVLAEWATDEVNDNRSQAAVLALEQMLALGHDAANTVQQVWLLNILRALYNKKAPSSLDKALDTSKESAAGKGMKLKPQLFAAANVLHEYINSLKETDEVVDLNPTTLPVFEAQEPVPTRMSWFQTNRPSKNGPTLTQVFASAFLAVCEFMRSASTEEHENLVRMGVLPLLLAVNNNQDVEESRMLRLNSTRLVAMLSATQSGLEQVRAHYQEFKGWLLKCRAVASEVNAGGGPDRLVLSHVKRALAHMDDCEGGIVYPDGVHFLDCHASDVAAHGEGSDDTTFASTMVDNTGMDIVFVHGLAGGPFMTWRTQAAGTDSWANLEEGCEATVWPSDWLSKDFPNARILTVGYRTSLVDSDNATLSIEAQGEQLLEKLVRAGVGQRPVIWVCHSLGGLLAKQIMMSADRSEDSRVSQVSHQSQGIAFYSTPHFGASLASFFSSSYSPGAIMKPFTAKHVDGMKLGHPHLEALNQNLRERFAKGDFPVISFGEGAETPLLRAMGVALRAEVVAMESAWPGFGDLVVLEGVDHIATCKPAARDDIAYTRLVEFLHQCAGVVRSRSNPSMELFMS